VVHDFVAICPTLRLAPLFASREALRSAAVLRRNAAGQREMAIAGYHIAISLGLPSVEGDGSLSGAAFRRAIDHFSRAVSPSEFQAFCERRPTIPQARRQVLDRRRELLRRGAIHMAFWKLEHDPTSFERETGRPPQPSEKLKRILGDVRSGLAAVTYVRVGTCRLPHCKRLFFPRTPAQKFCDACKRELTPSQRFYRAHRNSDPRTRN
jgi:hypothetical protein